MLFDGILRSFSASESSPRPGPLPDTIGEYLVSDIRCPSPEAPELRPKPKLGLGATNFCAVKQGKLLTWLINKFWLGFHRFFMDFIDF